MNPSDSNAQRQILKSTSIIGGASILNILFKILQSKAIALFIGPIGIGSLGLYNSIIGVSTTVAGMGLGTSGVRQIVDVAGTKDPIILAKTVIIFRRITLFFGVLAMALIFMLRQLISQMTFGSGDYANAIGLLAAVPLLAVLAGAQSTLLRGMRLIGEMASASIIGVAAGTILGLPLLYFWGTDGIAPYLLTAAILNSLITWGYARRIKIASTNVNWQETIELARPLLTLGVVFMISGMTTVFTLYLIRVMITQIIGLDAAGLFEASSAISNIYVGFILGAMGADFLPHLTSVIHDHSRSTQLINAQIEIGLLLATPGLLTVLLLGPWLLHLLYSPDFTAAFEILRWQVLGTFLRVVTWALGYLLLAKGRGSWFFWTELSINIVYIGVAVFGIYRWGVQGIGIAFAVAMLLHLGLMSLCARHLIDFSWSLRNKYLMIIFIPLLLLGFTLSNIHGEVPFLLGVLLVLGTALYTIKSLNNLLGPATFITTLQKFKSIFIRT